MPLKLKKEKRNHRKKHNKNKILITSGHAATTVIAVIEELRSRKPKRRIYWIGSKYAFEGKRVLSLEYKIAQANKINFYSIFTGKFTGKLNFWGVISLIKIPFGFLHALILITKIKPDVVLSFGGFAALPIVVIGKLASIPVVIHEQTSAAGRANLISAKFASKIAVSRRTSLRYFPSSKTVLTGNPIAKAYTREKLKRASGKLPVVFVTGGSRGSQNINNTIIQVLPELLSKYILIHQVGEVDHDVLNKYSSTLSPQLRRNYELHANLAPEKMASVLRRTDLVIARAGANTVSEIIASKLPAILIPIAWSNLNEQQQNAEFAQQFGLATILSESALSKESLISVIAKVLANRDQILTKVKDKISPDLRASKLLVNGLEEYLQ